MSLASKSVQAKAFIQPAGIYTSCQQNIHFQIRMWKERED